MRAPRRLLAALAALALLALLALAVALPRLAASDTARARLTDAVEKATKRSFGFASLDAGLLPPHLAIEAPVLRRQLPDPAAPDAPEPEPAASARRVELRLALLPLLARTVVVRSLVVEGGAVHLVREEGGLRLAGRDLPEPPPEAPRAPDGESRGESGGVAFAVKRVVLRGGALRLTDRTRQPAAKLALRDVEGELVGTRSSAPIEATLRAALEEGGSLALRGSGRPSGPFEARLELAEVALAPFAGYAPAGSELRARASGSLEVGGEGEARRAKLDLRLAAEELAAGALRARGPLAIRAELSAADPRTPSGPLAIEAGAAELELGGALRKPAGVPASLRATLRRERGAKRSLRLEAAELTLAGLRATGLLELAPVLRASLEAAPCEAATLAALLPSLHGRELVGRLSLERLVVEARPPALRGRMVFDGVGVGGAGEGALALHGALVGQGDAVEGEDLRVRLGGREAPLALRVADLGGAARFEFATRAQGADSSALVAALGGDRERLSGPLDLDARLAGPLRGEQPLLEALRGEVGLRIAPGRLRKVSLLRDAFAAAGAAGGVRPGGIERYAGDEFESLSGRFRIAGGAARTEDLRLVYAGYTAALRGEVGLADRALDLRGTLALAPEAEAALGAGSGRGREIPLASITGTLDEPRVSLTPEAIAGVAAAYAGDERRREKWERKLDERLGEGRGKEVLRAVDQLLDSMQKPGAGEAEPKP